MKIVHVIRHGRPASTWGGADDDPGLDEVGLAQARAVADEILSLPEPERPSCVVSSPLRRCRETAAPLAEALGVALVIDPRVGEIPTPAALSAEERPAWLRAAFGGHWDEIVGDLDYTKWTRAVAAALGEHGGAAVFSHFVALNGAVSVATGRPEVMAFRPDHCSRTVFGIEDDRLILIAKGREAQSQVL
ncbi:phosphoglycerate mutase family protein [Caulobacter sp. SL161]|uniref:histidine phosphatase family protein n=1 Tax=Caulobacter sp. SL161 TaxID=2995156 RepID=UPI0022739012|nr:histidine phosphatase family protein [Caulobacter sp. SL161]MCY1647932.1 phosphoglycerate mutase family protein [Caulobacter sp. SL161]